MAKMREMLEDPKCAALIRDGRIAEFKRRLENLVPVEDEGF